MASSVTVNMAVGGLDKFKSDMGEAQKAANLLDTVTLEKFGKQLDNIGKAAMKGLSSISNMAKGLWKAEVDATQWADDLITTSARFGVGVEDLQKWQLAAELVDTSVEDLLGAQAKMVAKMQDTNKTGQAAFEGLGVSIRDAGGNLRSTQDIFWDTVEAIGNLDNETEKEMYAQQLFGRSYKELMTLFQQGKSAWDLAGEQAQIISEEDVNNLGKANDAYVKLQQSWEATKLQLFASLAPAFESIAGSLTVLSNSIGEWLKTEEGRAAIESFGTAISNLITGFTDQNAGEIFSVIKDGINGLKDALLWIGENYDKIIGWIGGIAAGFAALKIGTDVMQFISSVKGILGIGGIGDIGGDTAGVGVDIGEGVNIALGELAPTLIAEGVSQGVQALSAATNESINAETEAVAAGVQEAFAASEAAGTVTDEQKAAKAAFDTLNQNMQLSTESGMTLAEMIASGASGILGSADGGAASGTFNNMEEVIDNLDSVVGVALDTLDPEKYGSLMADALRYMQGDENISATDLYQRLWQAFGETASGAAPSYTEAGYANGWNAYTAKLAEDYYAAVQAAGGDQYAESVEAAEEALQTALRKQGLGESLIDEVFDQILQAGENTDWSNSSAILEKMFFGTGEGYVDLGVKMTASVTQGVNSGVDAVAAAGAALAAAVASQVAAAAAAAYRAPNFTGFPGSQGSAPGTVYKGGNLYVGNMNMSGPVDAEGLMRYMNQSGAKTAAGFGGRP